MCFNLFSKTKQGSYEPDTKPATESVYGLKKSPNTDIQSEVHSYSDCHTFYRDRRSNIITGNFSELPTLAKMWKKLIKKGFTYKEYKYRTRTDETNSGDGSEKSLVRLIDIGDDPVINSFPIKLVKFIRDSFSSLSRAFNNWAIFSSVCHHNPRSTSTSVSSTLIFSYLNSSFYTLLFSIV